VLLIGIAVILATETKSLIIGESAVPEQIQAIHTALLSSPGVQRVIHLRTMHLGPDELLLAAKIGVAGDAEGRDIAVMIDDAEARVRAAVPTAKVIYLEPDIYRPSSAASGS
jgi:divalent metal cation (Fe/Co/Zn/Cd) transporter